MNGKERKHEWKTNECEQKEKKNKMHELTAEEGSQNMSKGLISKRGV